MNWAGWLVAFCGAVFLGFGLKGMLTPGQRVIGWVFVLLGLYCVALLVAKVGYGVDLSLAPPVPACK